MIFYILVYCEDIAGISDLGLDPMIVFVIRLRASIAPIISQIRDQILKLQTSYNFNPEYFTRFAVAVFNNDRKYRHPRHVTPGERKNLPKSPSRMSVFQLIQGIFCQNLFL